LEDGKFPYVCDVSFGRLTGGSQDEQDVQGTYNVVARSPNHCYTGNSAFCA